MKDKINQLSFLDHYEETRLERNKGKQKVDSSNDQSDGCSVVESKHGEYGCRVVHQSVETAQLLGCLQSTSND